MSREDRLKNGVLIFRGVTPAPLWSVPEPVRVGMLPAEMKRKHYFDRDDKDEIYRFIRSFPDGEDLLRNVIEAHFGLRPSVAEQH